MRLDDLNHKTDDRTGSEKLSTALTFLKREVAKEILIDLPENIPRNILWNILKILKKLY